MNNQSADRLTEAIWALTNELALHRQQPAAPTTEPSHTGAAPVTSGEFRVGDWVRVVEPGPMRGREGRVRSASGDQYVVDFSGGWGFIFRQSSLTPVPPRH